jgi:hypothetical protein
MGGTGAGDGAAGGDEFSDGGLCAPCVESSDCASGSACLGGTNPRCGIACTTTAGCTGGEACVYYGEGGKTPSGGTCGSPTNGLCGISLTAAGLSCADTWDSYASAVFTTTTCIGSCHRHDGQFSTVDAVRSVADTIRYVVENGIMPAGQPLSAPDRLRLLTWVACGAP